MPEPRRALPTPPPPPPPRVRPDWIPGSKSPETGGCQWLEGDARERNFCGEAVSHPGSPWCKEHRAIVFRPGKTRAA